PARDRLLPGVELLGVPAPRHARDDPRAPHRPPGDPAGPRLSPGAARCPRAPGGRPVIQSGRHATPGPRAADLPRRRTPTAPPPEHDARASIAAPQADTAI